MVEISGTDNRNETAAIKGSFVEVEGYRASECRGRFHDFWLHPIEAAMHSAAASMVDMGTLFAACLGNRRRGLRGQQIELTGEITRIDEAGGRVTVGLGPLVTVDIDKVRLVEKYRPPKRKKLLRDMVD